MRRLWVLVSQLPNDSAVARAQNPETFHWRTEHELLALLAEVIDAGARNLFVATLAPHVKRGAKVETWPPVTIPRPHRPAPRRTTTLDIRARMMGIDRE